MNNVIHINNRATIKNKLPMKSRVKNEAYVLYIDGHYVPFGENIFEENGKQTKNYIHYGHYKELNTARLIAEMHLVATGRLLVNNARDIKVTEEFKKVSKRNQDIMKLIDRYKKEYDTQVFLRFINEIDSTDIDGGELIEEVKHYVSFTIEEDDIPF